MAINAYVAMKISAKEAENILKTLKKRAFTVSVDAVTGTYDIIALVRASDFHSLGKIVLDEIASLKGVEDTETFPIIEFGR
ncbi:Lrp/AsnC ligand binding domain-containing protein [candidate division WOR-3 bacterium]|nr:Lrp/AsnC ligand binding domain-containing protein [candidate division WOR-3 bacterium]